MRLRRLSHSLLRNNGTKKALPPKHFKSLENQRDFMHKLYHQFNLQSFDEWRNISLKLMIQQGGWKLLKEYNENMEALLCGVFPHYPPTAWTVKTRLDALSAQQQRMEKLYRLFRFSTLEEWVSLKRGKFRDNGGEYLLRRYQFNYELLLQTIYPNYPWKFPTSETDLIDVHSIEQQRLLMDKLYDKLNLQSLEQWRSITKNKLYQHGAYKLLYQYRENIETLLPTLYPYYPWDDCSFKVHTRSVLKTIHTQRAFMDRLFVRLNYKTMDDWLHISHTKIARTGGMSLITKYKRVDLILKAIYPNYPWEHSLSCKYTFESIHQQREFMDRLYHSLNLQSLEEWQSSILSQSTMRINGGGALWNLYKNKALLLSAIYPHYPWRIIDERSYLHEQLKHCIVKYHITQKQTWYRLPQELGRYELIDALRQFYPSEIWRQSHFHLRNKKTSQRLLFAFTQKIYPSLLIFENYFHPQFVHSKTHYELDLFIPGLQLAMEYQGQHHYDDLPSGFAAVELFRSRDQLKEKLAAERNIHLLSVPYWWDQSEDSLRALLYTLRR